MVEKEQERHQELKQKAKFAEARADALEAELKEEKEKANKIQAELKEVSNLVTWHFFRDNFVRLNQK